jgi:DNA mismatch endonuclease (patch repair protein)
MDTLTRAERSKRMSRVRGSGNKSTELRLIEVLRTAGIVGWRRRARLLGSPDFVWRHKRVALFVDGCFWHGCPRHARLPKSRKGFWVPKLTRTKERDRVVSRALRSAGWTVVRIWEHDLAQDREERLLARLRRALAL